MNAFQFVLLKQIWRRKPYGLEAYLGGYSEALGKRKLSELTTKWLNEPAVRSIAPLLHSCQT